MVILIVIIAVTIRAVYVFKYDPGIIYAPDGNSYISLADNLISGKGFINSTGGFAVLPPIFSLWVALLFSLFGKSIVAIRLSNIFFSIITIIFIFLSTKEITKDKLSSYFVLLVSAIYPGYIVWSGYEITDAMFAMFVSAIMYLSLLLIKDKINIKKIALLGLLIGLANLIRGNLIIYPVLVSFALFIKRDFKKGLITATILIACSMVPLMIWGARNYYKFGEFIPIASHGATALYYGNNPKSFSDKFHTSISEDKESDFIESVNALDSKEANKKIQERVIQYIIENPKTFIKNTVERFFLYLKPVYINSAFSYFLKSKSLLIDKIIYYSFIIGSAVLSYIAVVYKKYIRETLILFALFFSISASYSVTAVVPSARYRLPIMGVEIIVAVVGIRELWNIGKEKINSRLKEVS